MPVYPTMPTMVFNHHSPVKSAGSHWASESESESLEELINRIKGNASGTPQSVLMDA